MFQYSVTHVLFPQDEKEANHVPVVLGVNWFGRHTHLSCLFLTSDYVRLRSLWALTIDSDISTQRPTGATSHLLSVACLSYNVMSGTEWLFVVL